MRLRIPIDAGMTIARLSRLSGHQDASLAELVGIGPGRLAYLARYKYARPAEERKLIEALERIGGTLDGLTRNSR